MAKQLPIHTPDEATRDTISEALRRFTGELGYKAPYELLFALAKGELTIVPVADAVVGYIKINRRVATSEHECSECGNEIGNLDLYLTVYADGETGTVVCGDCATN